MSGKHAMRVLYVKNSSGLGGASRSLLDLLEVIDRERVEPIVLLPKHGPIEDKLAELDVKSIVISSTTSVTNGGGRVKTVVKELVNKFAGIRVAYLIRKLDIDIVHNNSMCTDIGLRAANLAKIPCIVHVRELCAEYRGAFNNEKLIRRLLPKASQVIFISEFVANKFQPWAGNAPTYILPDAIRLSAPCSCSTLSSTEKKAFTLLAPGRIEYGKGQIDAIKATELLGNAGVNVELILLGALYRSGYYDDCEDYIKDNHLSSVQMLPFSNDIADDYAKADAVLMCAIDEGLGRVTVEGMLAGKLVIAAESGATPELISDGQTGLLYKPGDPNELASKIEWAINNPNEAARIAETGHSYAKSTFDLQVYANNILDIYEGCLSV
jgi:glycosyltransferase involved in cell wall biosynthesis